MRCKIAIVGSGVVGTATGAGFRTNGHAVSFCDIAPDRLRLLRNRGFEAVEASRLGPDFDAYLLSVPTPTRDGRVDLSYVVAAARTIGNAIRDHEGVPLVVVRSTVPPGTSETLVREAVEESSGRSAGEGFGLCMNPEFLRAVSAEQDFLEPRAIVIGAFDEASEHALRRLYEPWPEVPVYAMGLRTAEMAKYTCNLFNAAKISFFNELEQIALAIDADPRAAFAAAAAGTEGLWNPHYGTRGLAPYGGACLPKDTVGFLGFAADCGLDDEMPLLRATIEVNDRLEQALAAEDLEQVEAS
jgi:UDPglucose 6-dehydrogenase